MARHDVAPCSRAKTHVTVLFGNIFVSATLTNSRWIDAQGTEHPTATGAVRIVSLVPSITELLFDLGLQENIVGRTGFCIHPKALVRRVAKVGGTKTVDIAKVRKLAPTHLIVNIDENQRPVVEELATFVPHVLVTHPIQPEDNLALFRLMGGVFGREKTARALSDKFAAEVETTRREAEHYAMQKVLYLIWKSPWMTVSRDTYISRMLNLVRWQTVPEAPLSRYPSIEFTPQLMHGVSLILLSSEPYSFVARHVQEIKDELPPQCHPRIELIDGGMTSWYGSRSIQGVRYLRQLRRNLAV